MTIRKAAFGLLLVIYGVMWVGGIGSHIWFDSSPAQTAVAAPLFLLLAGLIVIVTSSWRERAALALAAALGFAAEVVGVRHGFLFGDYAYTDALAPRLLGVPLVMASAWMTLAAYALAIT